MMLHLHPELVQMAHADNFVSTSVGLEAAGGILTPEGGIGFGWMAQDLHLSGTTGNAAAADAERGAIATDRAARSLLKLAREVQTFNTDFLTANTAFNHK